LEEEDGDMTNGYWYIVKSLDGTEHYRSEDATEAVLWSIEKDKTLPPGKETQIVVAFKYEGGIEEVTKDEPHNTDPD
jgi:hypothetical protein